jgi:altronate hydrolase
MRWWEAYAASHDASIDNNPAPGNKEGGITTIYEKALGAVAKGGTSTLEDVLAYAEPVRVRGLSFMDTPGMDDVSTTGLVAGGCTVIAFTTGRGSCLAFGPVPVVKIASNSATYARMRGDMDFNAGSVLGNVPIETAAHDLAELIIQTASGRRTCGEAAGLGDHTFAPWDLGPTL